MKRFCTHCVCIVLVLLYASVAFAEFERVSIPLEGSPSRGSADARVVIVEFLDYQ